MNIWAKWAVYWQPGDDIEIRFFPLEADARDFLKNLMRANKEANSLSEEHPAFRDITLLQVRGEVREIPFGLGDLAFYEEKS
jgi:hypothetical protein